MLEEVLDFIRIDGPLSAPVTFLTTEDGGAWETNPITREELDGYISQNQPWIPNRDHGVDLGTPGVIIPKIMLAMFGNQDPPTQDWRGYRRDLLYRVNECNIKFYPLGRPNTSFWPGELTDLIGCDEQEYYEWCIISRPNTILERDGFAPPFSFIYM